MKNMSEAERSKRREEDIIYGSIFECSVIPFAIKCPKLVLDVAPYLDQQTRKVVTTSEEVIADFSADGIEEAFGWSNREISYTYTKSAQVYTRSKPKPSGLLRTWMREEFQDDKHQDILKVPRWKFNKTTNIAICFLCWLIGKQDNGKFVKDFCGFLVEIGQKKALRWSQIISDAIISPMATVRE